MTYRKASFKYHRFLKIITGIFAVCIFCSFSGYPDKIDDLPSIQGNGYQHNYKFPVKKGPATSRYLVDQKDEPFFWSGDAAWSLIAQPDSSDVILYLDDRQQKGFSVIMVNLIEHKFCTNPPANYYGEQPFTGRSFVRPNENYFTFADFVIREAGKRNIVVLLAPIYLGYGCGDEGWCTEAKAALSEEMRAWGRFVGSRYRSFDNIIWLIGGDTDPSQIRYKTLEVVHGILETDKRHLLTAHNNPGSFAVTPWQDQPWVDINNIYKYDSILYILYKEAYLRVPVLPFFQIESAYENEHHSTPSQLRAQAYEAILCGGMGHVFGNCPIWHFGYSKDWCGKTDWKTELDNDGSKSMQHLQELFSSRAWYRLVPDFGHQVLTDGYGKWGSPDYVTAAKTDDGNTLIVYMPTPHTITVDLSKIRGSAVKYWWYKPSNGEAGASETVEDKELHHFAPPAAGDWVFVIDNADLEMAVPGRQTKP